MKNSSTKKPKIPRVFCGSIATETNTFSPLRTDLSDFEESFYAQPNKHPKSPTLCSAVFTTLRKYKKNKKIKLFEGTATWAEPGGLVNQNTWEKLRDEVIGQVKKAMPLDAVVLGLHGAMIAEKTTDCEGELIQKIRKITGKKCVIGVTFDPHSHLSTKRTKNADVITAFKEFPHIDFIQTAEDCVKLVLKKVKGEIKPHIAVADAKMIDILPTTIQPMRGFVDKIKKMERKKNNGVLSVSVIHGFMAGDSPDVGAKIIVITDDQPENGKKIASELANELFGFRGKTKPKMLSPKNAIQIADKQKKYPVVIADVWDNPGGGTAGDSTVIINEAIKQKTKGIAATIWDPMAVKICFAAGKNAKLNLRFGGKTSANAGQPIDATVTVTKLVGNATQKFGSSVVPLGNCAAIKINDADIVLNSNRAQTFSPDLFKNLGINIRKKRIVIVKSTNHFYNAFEPIAKKIIYAAVEGPYPNNPTKNKYKKLKRKIWPIVKNPFGKK